MKYFVSAAIGAFFNANFVTAICWKIDALSVMSVAL